MSQNPGVEPVQLHALLLRLVTNVEEKTHVKLTGRQQQSCSLKQGSIAPSESLYSELFDASLPCSSYLCSRSSSPVASWR